MAKSKTKTAPPSQDVLDLLPAERIGQVTDVSVKATLTRARALAAGLVSASGAEAQALASVGLDVDDARGFLADAVHLLEQLEDRDKKQAQASAAVAALRASEAELTEHLSSAAHLLRGKLGPKSPALTKFGLQPLAVGGRRKRAKKEAEPK